MKISYQWLTEWVNIKQSPADLAELLTQAGLEVEDCLPVADDFSGVVIAEIKNVERHPEAERLSICQVDAGDGKLHTVVCAAPNVAPGIKAPYAQVGAMLRKQTAQPQHIQETTLRGVPSAGMLCSAADLGMAENSEGLFLLPKNAAIGTDLRDYLQLDDSVLDIQLTPNRGDCLSLMGIAREVGVLNRELVRSLTDLPNSANLDLAVTVADNDTFPIQIQAEQACWRYAGRIIKNIDNTVPTPVWMQERLRRGGIRSISLIVDIMNYVMLEVGQPLHAFDLSTLSDAIQVRYAVEGETLTLLDNQNITIKPNTLIIADTKGPLAIAGIMGGLDSAVTLDTQSVFIESAFFHPDAILGRARNYGLQTDAAHRFERGVDPSLALPALERATALLLALGGGSVGPVNEVTTQYIQHTKEPIILESAFLEKILGVALPANEVMDILRRLGNSLTEVANGWEIKIPTYRFDMSQPEDLIEEIARIYGYTRLPAKAPQLTMALPFIQQQHLTAEKFGQVLVARGYQEVITYSFIDPNMQNLCDPENPALPLLNPIASDLSVMRTNLWPGLLSTLQYNINRQCERARLFEHGLCFIQAEQQPRLAGLVMGTASSEKWHANTFENDFYTLKADVLALLALTHDVTQFTVVPAEHPALHPGQSAKVENKLGQTIGLLGAFHPHVLQSLDIKGTVYGFELILSALNQAKLPKYQPLSPFPHVRRDLALILQQDILAADVIQVAREAAGEWLVDITLFDVYQGTGIADGYKSLAIGLTLQHPQRTLTDAEIDAVIQNVIASLQKQFHAELRK
ncbi:MAG: phenylalanine--tRNA ligase subunit beta [Gammaproteobacteria bacterium]